jgi:hypothetical protein
MRAAKAFSEAALNYADSPENIKTRSARQMAAP